MFLLKAAHQGGDESNRRRTKEGESKVPINSNEESDPGVSMEGDNEMDSELHLKDIAGHCAKAATKQTIAAGVVRGYGDGKLPPGCRYQSS